MRLVKYFYAKICIRCSETKELSLFTKRKENPDGHLNICKSCTCKRARESRVQRRLFGTAAKPIETGAYDRICTTCGVSKRLAEFPKNSKCSEGRTRVCKLCTNSKSREWLSEVGKNDPEFLQRRFESQEKEKARKYKITVEDLRNMREQAKGLCSVCNLPPTLNGKSSMSLHIDHCHETGRVRGLLCARCNLTLGRAEDDPELLRKLASYLERHKHVDISSAVPD